MISVTGHNIKFNANRVRVDFINMTETPPNDSLAVAVSRPAGISYTSYKCKQKAHTYFYEYSISVRRKDKV